MAGTANLSLQSPRFCCSKLFQMSKGHHCTGISQGGQLVGITSFPEKYHPWRDSDLSAANSSHTEVPLKSNRTQGDNIQLPYSGFLLLTVRSFRNRAGEVVTGTTQGLAVRVLWPPLGCPDLGTDTHIVHRNVYIWTSATSFLGLFSSQNL